MLLIIELLVFRGRRGDTPSDLSDDGEAEWGWEGELRERGGDTVINSTMKMAAILFAYIH